MTKAQEIKMYKYLADGYQHGASTNGDLVMIKSADYKKHVVSIRSDGYVTGAIK